MGEVVDGASNGWAVVGALGDATEGKAVVGVNAGNGAGVVFGELTSEMG